MLNRPGKLLKLIKTPGLAIFLASFILGCSNIFNPVLISGTLNLVTTSNPSPLPSPSSSGQAQIFVSTANPTTTSQSGGTPTTSFNVFFDTLKSGSKISAHCNITTATGTTDSPSPIPKPCSCQFSWNQTNPNNPVALSTLRNVLTTISFIGDYQVTCPAPDVYSSEVPNGTQIQIKVVPATSNPDRSTFIVNPYSYMKNNSSSGANFQDNNGNFYVNILRYSCYQTVQKTMTVQSKVQPYPNPTSGVAGDYIYATQFCVSKSGGGALPQGCPTSSPDYSAQSYYYNLYIRSSEAGGIQQYSPQFSCPIVREPLSGSNSPGLQGSYWPLDANFALSLGPTATFPVGVVAQSKLSDGIAQSSTCYPSTNASGTPGASNTGGATTLGSPGMISTCLGFAALPNSNGSCPAFRNLSNQVVPTYRLRRFVAMYPRIFDAAGNPFSGMNQGLDTIYVLDRPIANSLATYGGPKPCPFAFFDKMSVVPVNSLPAAYNGIGGYIGTNQSSWGGKNVDGTEFPNVDGNDFFGAPSCSTALPLLVSNNGIPAITFQTININNNQALSRNHVYVRPIQPFSPNYVEDTQFLACAPQASPQSDPPLHFAADPTSNQMAWCAEVYPTQNDNLASLDPPFNYPGTVSKTTGGITPYTSHTAKNTAGQCTATPITLPASYSSHPQWPGNHSSVGQIDGANASLTCDRTVLNTSGPGANVSVSPQSRFPLLARAPDVELALQDSTSNSPYLCKITYDPTGANPILNSCCATGVIHGTAQSPNTPVLPAHLEPTTTCGTPTY